MRKIVILVCSNALNVMNVGPTLFVIKCYNLIHQFVEFALFNFGFVICSITCLNNWPRDDTRKKMKDQHSNFSIRYWTTTMKLKLWSMLYVQVKVMKYVVCTIALNRWLSFVGPWWRNSITGPFTKKYKPNAN